jgi:hypothetical protein
MIEALVFFCARQEALDRVLDRHGARENAAKPRCGGGV